MYEIGRVSGGNYLIHTVGNRSIYPWIINDIVNIFNKSVIDGNSTYNYTKPNKFQKLHRFIIAQLSIF